jgi:hypothetical protein
MKAVKACVGEVTNLEGMEAGSRLPSFWLRRRGDECFGNKIKEDNEERLTWIYIVHVKRICIMTESSLYRYS